MPLKDDITRASVYFAEQFLTHIHLVRWPFSSASTFSNAFVSKDGCAAAAAAVSPPFPGENELRGRERTRECYSALEYRQSRADSKLWPKLRNRPMKDGCDTFFLHSHMECECVESFRLKNVAAASVKHILVTFLLPFFRPH